MAKFAYSDIGDDGVRFLFAMGSRRPGRYFRAVDALVHYGSKSVAEVLQNLDAAGGLYQYDPDSYTGAPLRAALEQYGDAREAELAAKAARRKARG